MLKRLGNLPLFTRRRSPPATPPPAPPVLPRWAKRIDTRYRTLMDAHGIEGPVCHVGSLINKEGTTEAEVQAWRGHFAHLREPGFVGVDLFPGVNVDVVADICSPTFLADHPALAGRFGLAFCSAVLEHVAQPFDAARNIAGLLRPGGHLYCAGPWVWGYHGYPADYWRISVDGLKALFPDFAFAQWWYAGTVPHTGIEITEPKLERKIFQLNKDLPDGAWRLISDRAMPYLNVGAIARKP